MQTEHLTQLKAWFDAYTRSYLTGDDAADSPLALKIVHTTRVCGNMVQLARAIDMRDDQIRIAETVGLFHDIGRFEQYRRYRTFNDRESTNHATLGIEELKKAAVLHPLPADERNLIIEAIRYHNTAALPNGRPTQAMVFMRMIRDADKLDIWRVFADYYRQRQELQPVVFQHLTDRPTWEVAIVDAIAENRMARLKDMQSLNDLKLLHLSWVFDLHFRETFVQARRRGDLATIAGTLPEDPAVRLAVSRVMARLAEMQTGTDLPEGGIP